ncbi:MAG: ribosome-associated translation inhibitor RaiA [Oscillospiraceae bacterium]|jgi:putative sigma-54 modulation protein|nr:ribosome-associated translation inhibitor RaiA [Oscillospiraceae bacterium]
MKITIVGRKCTPRESFKERAEKKLSKIEKFFSDESEAKITATVERNKKIVEIMVMHNNMIFRAEESANDLEDALDHCVDRLIRQIRKNKTKVEKTLRKGAFDEFMEETNGIAEETEFDVVRVKTLTLKPQSVDEAILQMNMIGHHFYVFFNNDTEAINVVYKRNDDGYGVIEPNV